MLQEGLQLMRALILHRIVQRTTVFAKLLAVVVHMDQYAIPAGLAPYFVRTISRQPFGSRVPILDAPVRIDDIHPLG
jgi:hypothetical protein